MQTDRQDKSALGYEQPAKETNGHARPTPPSAPHIDKGRASNLRAKFERLASDDVWFCLLLPFLSLFWQLSLIQLVNYD